MDKNDQEPKEQPDQPEPAKEFVRVLHPKLVFSWGCNAYGQLGRPGTQKPCSLPEIVDFTEEIIPGSIKQIAIGLGNTYILMDSGELYGNGLNNIRQLGNAEFLGHEFKKIENVDELVIDNIAVLWDSIYAVTRSGNVIGWGSNAYGQLGLDPGLVFSSRTPVVIWQDSKVVQVGAGLRHCVMLMKKGRVLTCGDSKKGQLGRPWTEDFRPQEVKLLRNVKQIAVGQYHNIALVKIQDDYKVYSWGLNAQGQCGVDPSSNPIVSIPMEIKFSDPIMKASSLRCGWSHSGLLNSDGQLYLWGDNRYGQLGDDQSASYTPKRPATLALVKDFDLGFGHTVVALAETGMLLAWGDNAYGCCGIGDTVPQVNMPVKTCVGLKRVAVRIFAGYKQNFALTV
ncbi:Regulator of chromosome condensation (RCC1) repeat [Nesidiocoris tenuis]|uniref:Regulator of chromosome condensation (RCC1) repeat n=1 Tax=Nesidiocoris tenuis TaxID=355587 RepID=A0ABN7B3X5_9HEMI|nr:Regulator of chromosome condensation (RCC1) repeat [Nesidiocoris tenuis]